MGYAYLRRAVALATMAAFCTLAAAASGPAALIEFTSGDDIVVIRNARRLAFSDPIGLSLIEGDQVQTGKGVFVELRLSSGGSLIRLAENTTFVLERISDGQTLGRLVYGRMRAKVERLAGADSFSIASAQAVAGVRGTDFGMDVVASRSASTVSTVTTAYCFQGAIEVTAFVRSGTQAAEALEAIPRVFTVGAGEMLRVEGNEGRSEASKGVVDESIESFWRLNDYVSVQARPPIVPDPELSEVESPSPVDAVALEAAFAEGRTRGYAEAKAEAASELASLTAEASRLAGLERAVRLQKTGAGIGLGICVAGGALALSGVLLAPSDPGLGQALLQAGAIASASALPFLALTILVRP